MKKGQGYFYVYMMSNNYNTVLYTGVTNNLIRRVAEHKSKSVEGFTKRYNVTKLVYYEVFTDSTNAIAREKNIKSQSRAKKDLLVRGMNPSWNDLFEEISIAEGIAASALPPRNDDQS